jgi:hypothetical protein
LAAKADPLPTIANAMTTDPSMQVNRHIFRIFTNRPLPDARLIRP